MLVLAGRVSVVCRGDVMCGDAACDVMWSAAR